MNDIKVGQAELNDSIVQQGKLYDLVGGAANPVVSVLVVEPSHEDRVRQMMQGFGQECPTSPTVSDYKTRELRVRLMLEEVMEYADAAGVMVCISTGHETGRISFDELFFNEAFQKPNLVDMADAVADCSVTMVGTAIAHGMPLEAILEEVDASNLRKFDGGYKDENGKFRKPANWKPPHIERVLREHGWKPDEEPMKEDAPPS